MRSEKTYPSGKVCLSTHVKGKERKEPVWELRYRLPSGKASDKVLGKAWLKKSRPATGYLTEAQAHAAGQAFLDEHADAVPEDRVTFKRGLDRFIAECRDKNLKGETFANYENIGKLLCKRGGDRPWGDRLLDSFSTGEIAAVRKERNDLGRASNTMNQWRRVVRGIFGTHAASPANGWDWKGADNKPKDDRNFYGPEEAARLIAAAEDDMDAAIFTLAIQAGPRKSEIRALRVKDCDFEHQALRFVWGYTNAEGFADTKGKVARTVPMSPAIATRLAPFCEGKDDHDLVFQSERGAQAICGSALYRRFVAAAERAGLRPVRFHDLRGSFATRAIREHGIYKVQRWLGHKHISTTEGYLSLESDPEDAASMGDLWAVASEANVVPIGRRAA